MAAVDPTTRFPDDEPPAPRPYEEPVAEIPSEPIDPAAVEPGEESQAVMPETNDPEGEIAELEDRSMPIQRTLWAINARGERHEETYTQEGLKWFGKIELYGLLGQAVRVVLEGDNPLGIDSLLGLKNNPRQMIADMMGNLPGEDTDPSRADDDQEVEAGKVLAAFAQVVSMAPDLLKQAYCIVLAIPKAHRYPWAMEWALPNMEDDMGQDILEAFIDQNWGVMEDFFAREVPKIMKRVTKARQQHSDGRR